jgi:hypothetical protein
LADPCQQRAKLIFIGAKIARAAAHSPDATLSLQDAETCLPKVINAFFANFALPAE